MGTLDFFDINSYKDKGFNFFIETGTGQGLGVEYAKKVNFKTIISIEYVQYLYEEALSKYQNIPGIVIIRGVSWKVLELILPSTPEKCIFWLDAHLPGVDYDLAGLFDEKDPDIRMPLIKELETIKRLRHGEDIILIDDLRFYIQDDFVNGNLPNELICEGYEYISNMFKGTHEYRVWLEDDGYLEIMPKAVQLL